MKKIPVILLLLFTVSASGQQPFYRELWLNDNNAPVNVHAMVQTENGYIWLGTDAGLYRFNGRQFTAIRDSVHEPVTALSATKNGILWIGYKNGTVAFVENNKIQIISVRGIHPRSAINYIYANDDLIWFGTEAEGIFGLFHGMYIQCNENNGLSDNFVYSVQPHKNTVIAATDQGINFISYQDKRFSIKEITTANGLPDNIVRVLTPASQKHEWWIGTQNGGIALYNDSLQKIFRFFLETPWAYGQVNDIITTAPQHLYITTEEGYLLHGVLQNDSLILQAYLYRGKKLKKLLYDQAGNIWCATNQGIVMFTAAYAARINPGNNYSVKPLTALSCDRSFNLWYAQEDTIWKIQLHHDSLASFIFKLPARITRLYADVKGNLWIGTLGRGLWRRNTKGIVAEIKNIETLKNAQILNIAGAGDTIWASSLNGVDELLVKDDKPLQCIRRHTKNTGLGSDYIYQVMADKTGNTWFATDGAGICMFDGNTYHHWDSSSGFKSKVVYSITEDHLGNIWASTLDQGIYKYDGKQWTHAGKNEGLQDLNISSIVSNGTGEVVIVTQKGIDEWYPTSKEFRHYNKKLGVDIDSLSTVLNSIAKDKFGNLYVPYKRGFIQLKNQYVPYIIQASIVLDAPSVFFHSISEGKQNFLANENHLSFHFDGINFANPEKLFYRYMLEAYTTDWVSTNDETVTFPQLQPGRYRFRVQASLNIAFTNAAEADYSFVIALPFYKQPWFIVLVCLLLCALGYLYLTLRERNIKKMSQLQKERMLYEYEHLKSQVNPHFLFNSLNTLVSLIDEDKELAVNYTVQLSDLYRTALSFHNRDTILLREEWTILEKYFYIQQSRFGDALQWNVAIAQELMDEKRIVPMALQLLIENAIKHNVVSLSSPLIINIKADEEEIIVTNLLQPKMSKEKGAGLGIVNIEKRYALLTKKPVYFGVIDANYVVKLPLL